MILSKLRSFEHPKVFLEQYNTDPEVAEKLFNHIILRSKLDDLVVADLGAGTGILGIAALILGAKFVYFVEKDKEAIQLLKENLEMFNYSNFQILEEDVSNFRIPVNLVVMNPPFGTKQKHIDRAFYDTAFLISSEIYSITKTSTEDFVIRYAMKHGFSGYVLQRMRHLIKQQFYFHKSKTRFIDVSLMYFKKNEKKEK
ncbi:MAG: METTL5 family protein [Candidatus Woesearchaeota archaeon]